MKTNALIGSLFAASILAVGAIGCGGPSYEHTQVSDVSAGELPASISLSSISMEIGAATKAIIKPYDDDGEVMSGDVTSDDPQVLEIAPGLSDHEYMFMARTVGSTQVHFTAGGGVVAIAHVTISAQ